MSKTQVDLRVDQVASLRSVADMTGRSEGELIRSAVDLVIACGIADAISANDGAAGSSGGATRPNLRLVSDSRPSVDALSRDGS